MFESIEAPRIECVTPPSAIYLRCISHIISDASTILNVDVGTSDLFEKKRSIVALPCIYGNVGPSVQIDKFPSLR